MTDRYRRAAELLSRADRLDTCGVLLKVLGWMAILAAIVGVGLYLSSRLRKPVKPVLTLRAPRSSAT